MNDAMTTAARTNFSAWDWAIVVAYLLISLAIGLYVKRYATTMTSYIAAGRGVGVWLGVATMSGTEMGLITVMYNAEKGFKGGFAAFHIGVLAGLVTLGVGLSGLIVGPLRELGVLTIPEYYERRFGRKTRVLGGVVLALGGILNMGLFLKVGSMFIVGVTGLSHAGWAVPLVMTGLLTLVLVYTVLGGMISVVVTDYVQFVVLSCGMLLATLLAISQLGWTTIFEEIQLQFGAGGFDPLASPAFGPEYVVWQAVLGLVGCAVWPTAIARVLAMESPTAVKRQFTWSSIAFAIRLIVPCFWGICAFVFVTRVVPELGPWFGVGEGELAAGQEPVSALYAMPIFMGRLLPVGILGLVSAAMIAAFMSTHDSYLLCWSSVIVQDIIAPLRREPLSIAARVRLTRLLIVLIGGYIWAWGLFYEGGDDIWDYMAITGAIYFTGAFALLIGGLYWRGASSSGAFCALLAGCSAVLGLGPIRSPVARWLLTLTDRPATQEAADTLLSSARVGLLSVAFTLTVFVVVSLLRPDNRSAATTAAAHRGE